MNFYNNLHNYRTTINTHLIPAFGQRKLCEITTLEIQQFILGKFENKLGWESVARFRNLLSRMFAVAKKWGMYAGDNPATGVELPEKLTVREKHALTPEQVGKLLAALAEPFRTMVLLGIHTGLRVGEILGLRWNDVDFERKQLSVSQAIYRGTVGTPKTKGSKRSVPIPGGLLAALACHYRRSGNASGSELVFRTRAGTAFGDTNLLHRVLKPAGKHIGTPWLSWHTLRRTHCTLLQLAGGSIKDAQAQLGHARLATTLELYTMPLPAQQRAAVEKLEQLVTNGDEFGQDAHVLATGSQQIQ